MIRYIQLLTVLLFCYISSFSQISFYSATFKGGVTGGGYAPDYSGNGGTGTINVYIEPGSTIRQAYLFAGSEGTPNPLTVALNGTSLTFDFSSIVSPVFQSPDYGGNSTVHALDVTSVVSASVNSYSLTVPALSGPSNIYFDFYLFIAYDNASLPSVSTEFFVNDKNFGPDVTYSFNLAVPVNSTLPVAIGLDCGYMCSSSDADIVSLNGTTLGTIYGPESNSSYCAGPCSNFYYENNMATGLLDNNADQAMNGPDVLSNAQALIPNGSTSFTMEFVHGNPDNALWGFFIVSGASCALPVAEAAPADTGVCYGNPVQLFASGGSKYHWSPTVNVSDSTAANPVVYAPSTTTYTVTVTDNCGSSTSLVNIIVFPTPPTPTITPSNDTLYSGIDPGYSLYQWYYNDTLIVGATTPTYFATRSGNYNMAVTDTNGCQTSVGINIIVIGIPQFAGDGLPFSIFPNPVQNKFTIRDSKFTIKSIEIYNVLGEVCCKSEILIRKPEIQIDVSSLPGGIYFIQAENEKGRGVSKFVKE